MLHCALATQNVAIRCPMLYVFFFGLQIRNNKDEGVLAFAFGEDVLAFARAVVGRGGGGVFAFAFVAA